MTNRTTVSSQGESGNPPPPPPPPCPPDHSHGGNKVFKSGPLFLSSKGIGWTSWKKRWFILTRTSLVFFRSDPSAVPQKGAEVNLTLGGIDLNNTGSVVVKSDKKLLTVLFPDGRDGRAFTLKAETLEDLYAWKDALEEALAQAPSGTYVIGQNGVFRNDQGDAVDGTLEQSKEKQPVKSMVVGRPVLLALEDIDGTPSFLEKSLQFVEKHGVKVEGILRQAADVDDVERRIREYEQGKIDFSPEEDAHVIADCVKYVIRELPSSPVPASCCKALLEACRTDRSRRLMAMREAICETFPEPNRKLLQRILLMMQTVASHKAENRMSSSAVAACMAPLLLRPLLAGDCELEHDFDVGGDGSVQLLQAAAAANHAQAIVVTLLEEYESIFGGGGMSTELYSDSEESGSESGELTDDDETIEDDEDEYGTESSDVDEDFDNASNGTQSHTDGSEDDYSHDDKEPNGLIVGSKSNESVDYHNASQRSPSSSPQSSLDQHGNLQNSEKFSNQSSTSSVVHTKESGDILGCDSAETSRVQKLTNDSPSSCIQSSSTISNGPVHGARRPAVWGRTPAKKNLSMESIELPSEDEAEIERLEVTKISLQNRIAEEAKGNTVLQASLERRKNALHERRLVLEQDVARLQDQLQKERDLRTVLKSGLKKSQGSLSASSNIDEKTKAEIEEIAQMEADVIKLNQTASDLGEQLNQQREQNYGIAHGSCNQTQKASRNQSKSKEKCKNAEIKATHSSRRLTRNEGAQMNKLDHDKEMKQQLDLVESSKSHGVTATSTITKKFSIRGEGATPTSSALSKLTNRLNFLKERRSQIANEIHSFDKKQSPHRSGQSSERGIGSDSYHSTLDKFGGLDVGLASEGHQDEDTEILRIPDSWSLPNMDRGRYEDQPSPNLERGKSESFPNVDKGRRSDGHPLVPPRTYSR